MTDFGQRRRILPKTGQTTSYRDGDDGYYQMGWDEAERFKDVGDGTIIDNATGLMWPKDWLGAGGNGGVSLVWNAAIDWAEALDFAGYDDWRLPNAMELSSLTKRSGATPLIDDMFIGVNGTTGFYYTSTTTAYSTNLADATSFAYQATYYKLKFSPLLVVAVRNK